MMINLFDEAFILQYTVGCGELGLNGLLGYNYGPTDGKVYLNGGIVADAVISAHAPSVVVFSTRRPLALSGATHVSYWADSPAQYWVNDHLVGELRLPGENTAWVEIAPGEYTLRIETKNKNWAHTLWLLKRSSMPSTGRLAVVTVGCYEKTRLAQVLRWLFLSSAAHGVLVHVHGVGEELGNCYSRKIERLADFIGHLPQVYEWIVYLDGTDTLLIGNENEVVASLRDYGTPFIGTEACAFPCSEPSFTHKFKSPTVQRFPQAGIWGGPRKELLRTLWELQDLHYRLKTLRGPDFCYRNGRAIYNLWDDQFLWQVLHLAAPHKYFVPDYYWKLAANITCTSLNPLNDVFYVLDHRIMTQWGTRPWAIHVSGYDKQPVSLWAGILGPWR
ncbi:MAG: hypothetical protein QXS54_08935 [Candidatus Methanomethylicaceae archaeon]